MSETEGKTKGSRGGRRTAGAGKKIGAPFVLKGGKRYEVYLDDETIETLKKINPNRSEAIRILAKQFKENSL